MDQIHKHIQQLESNDTQIVDHINQLQSITSPTPTQTHPSSSSNTDTSTSFLTFLNTLGDGFIKSCVAQNPDPSAVQCIAEAFTTMCAQLGQQGVALK
eukprot:1037284-Karenia_brevis.AAC.1